MLFILLGSLGFLLYLLCDYFYYKNSWSVLLSIFYYISSVTIFISIFLLAMYSNRFYLSFYLIIISGILTLIFLFLLIKTLLFETDFSGKSTNLVTSGSYLISRHPGVLYLILLMFFLIFFSRSILLIYSFFVFSFLNLIIAYLEDIIFLPEKYKDYNEFKKHTPFLIPKVNNLQYIFFTKKNQKKTSKT